MHNTSEYLFIDSIIFMHMFAHFTVAIVTSLCMGIVCILCIYCKSIRFCQFVAIETLNHFTERRWFHFEGKSVRFFYYSNISLEDLVGDFGGEKCAISIREIVDISAIYFHIIPLFIQQ